MFRLKINLSDFFSDFRKNSIVTVNPEWENIKCLENHISKLFQLPDEIYLLNSEDKFHIPSEEKIQVIHANDILEVHAITNEGAQQPIKQPIKRKNSTNETEGDNCGDTKRKRKRKRQQKKGISFEEVSEKLNEIFNKPSTSLLDQNQTFPPAPVFSNERKHFRFNEDGDSDSNSCSSPENPQSFRIQASAQSSPLLKISSTAPKFVRAIEKIQILEPHVTAEKDVISPAEIEQVEEQEDKEEIKIQKETVNGNGENSPPDTNKTSAMEEIRQNVDSLNFDALTELPNENDVIAFKYLKLGDNYLPTLSDYVVGMVESIDEENRNVKIYVLAGNEEKIKTNGRFSVPEMSECDDIDDTGTLVLNMNEIVDGKVVKV